jgi:5'-nucleotidase
MKDRMPDLILSGVNRGANLAEDTSYSGTVAAAAEGALAGIRSIALSQVYARHAPGDDVSFAAAEAWGARVLAPLLDAPWAPRTLVNINFPPIDPDKVQGVRVVGQGLRDYGRMKVEQGTDPRGYEYHWLAMGAVNGTPAAGTDLEAVAQGYVSVTPLHMDLTHRPSLDALTALYG